MEQANALKLSYEKLVKKHKKLTKINNNRVANNIVDLKLALELQTTSEEISMFTGKYGKFIRRRNSSYGRFQVESYLALLQGVNNHKKADITNANFNNNLDITNITDLKKSNYNSKRDINVTNDELAINNVDTLTKKRRGKLANSLKVNEAKLVQNSKIHGQTIQNTMPDNMNNENIIQSNTISKNKAIQKSTFIYESPSSTLSTPDIVYNNYSLMSNDMNKDKKKRHNIQKNTMNHQNSGNMPYGNFFTQNNPSHHTLITKNSPVSEFNYCKNPENNTMGYVKQQNINYNDRISKNNLNVDYHEINYSNHEHKSKDLVHQTAQYNNMQYIKPNDIFQDSTKKNIKREFIPDRKNNNRQKIQLTDKTHNNSHETDICIFSEPTSTFKIPTKEVNEQEMERYIFQTVYDNNNPTDDELLTMKEVYDIFLETISHSACMLAKASNKSVVDETDVKLAMKMEFDVVLLDDVNFNLSNEPDTDYEKKIALIAREKSKRLYKQ